MHELTLQIGKSLGLTMNTSDDKVVRQWLEGIVKKLSDTPQYAIFPREARSLLGLSPEKEEPSMCGCTGTCQPGSECYERCHPKPQQEKREWCSHMKQADNGRYYINGVMVGEGTMNWPGYDAVWDICPVKGCHTPRPKSMTLAEKFKEAFQTKWCGFFLDEACENYAKIAEAHFKNPEKKSS